MRIGTLVGLALAIFVGARADGLPIDIVLLPEVVTERGIATFVVGVVDSSTRAGVDINGYTLDYRFDDTELSFIGARQIASFATLGALEFSAFGDCLSGRCTAGNVPGFDAATTTDLFELTFEVTDIVDDGLVDLEVGFLDIVFNDVTQATGADVFERGATIASSSVVPEPATGSLLALGLAGVAIRRRSLR